MTSAVSSLRKTRLGKSRAGFVTKTTGGEEKFRAEPEKNLKVFFPKIYFSPTGGTTGGGGNTPPLVNQWGGSTFLEKYLFKNHFFTPIFHANICV
jgi:hypothetical protein